MKIDGIPSLRDSEILGLYDVMVDEGVADTIFFDGEVSSRDDFLEAMTNHNNNILYVLKADGELAIACWLNHFNGKTAQMHWTCFRKFWNRG